MKLIERLGQLENPLISIWGGKVYWLDYLYKNGYHVAEGYCINKELFSVFMRDNNINLHECSVDSIFKYDEIKNVIYRSSFPKLMQTELENVYNSLKKPLIVRSSSVIEDSANYSCAGLFTSVGGIKTFEDMLKAIKKCWISTFNEAIDICVPVKREYGINLLIQEELEGESGGVAFSINPLTGEANEIVIESSPDGPKMVVSGEGNVTTDIFSKNRVKNIEESKQQIIEVLLAMESVLGTNLDMEWLCKDKILYILQVRPVTTIRNTCMPYINVDDKTIKLQELKNLLQIHCRWMEKKAIVRRFCKQKGIKIGEFYYWFRENDTDGKGINDIIDKVMPSDIYAITDGMKNELVKKENVKSLMIANKSPVIRIAESVPTHYCGFSSVLDDKYYIEVAKGGFSAFYKGEFEVTKYLVNEQGIIEKLDEKYFEEEYYLNENVWEKRKIQKELVKLSQRDLMEIVNITKILSEKFGNVRVEWILNDTGVYLYDVTVERGNLAKDYESGMILSTGNCVGKAKVLNNINIFNDEIEHVSVRMGYEFSELEEKASVKKIKESLNIDSEDIVVCEYPNERLAVLLDRVKGFVFERGSLLCHFAIILRERNIPAIVYPCATQKIKTGQSIMINETQITVK